MGSTAKQILERAIAQKILTEEQALELARLRHARKGRDGVAPAVEELAVEKGYLTAADAHRLRQEQEGFDLDREIGGYRIIEKIGSGTMGTVYKAKQVSLDRVVAIKVLSPHLSRKRDYVEQFLREARAVARLNHPNVISGIDVGEHEGVRYFVMEYASGLTVGEILKRGGAMDESRVAKVALQIARALEHAHEAGLVHRDVKPDNILITKNGTAKLCDLGLAKDRPEGGRALGTPHYISPEQAEGIKEADIRSDLYSFGATLYHMLVGKTPFEGKAKAVMVLHVSQDPKRLRDIDSDISEAMQGIVEKLMRKLPEERYQSPRELIGAIEAYEAAQRKKAAKEAVAPPLVRRPRRR
jgi:eukaryotic-like serine/threonine-protein kinase